MSEQRCTLLAPQYKAAANSCFVARREQLATVGVEKAQENFLQCIAQIPDPNFQACARGEQPGPSCNCGGTKPVGPATGRFRKRN